jgi:predicted transcriptional regulator
MAQRERILKSLSNAGLVVLEWKVTNHNAYIKTRLTEKGTKFLHKIAGLKAIVPNV